MKQFVDAAVLAANATTDHYTVHTLISKRLEMVYKVPGKNTPSPTFWGLPEEDTHTPTDKDICVTTLIISTLNNNNNNNNNSNDVPIVIGGVHVTPLTHADTTHALTEAHA